jgi:hypothetical protein
VIASAVIRPAAADAANELKVRKANPVIVNAAMMVSLIGSGALIKRTGDAAIKAVAMMLVKPSPLSRCTNIHVAKTSSDAQTGAT